MADEGIDRRLTAVLSADVEGYTRLMGQDEVYTIRTLKAHRDLVSDLVEQYKGRVIDTPGDNILAAFESVSNAVNCAVEIQRELAERNAEVPSARMMQWRIGISLGDVVEADGRIYGDGVNIADRVQKLAEGGGVCISGAVYDQVGEKLGLEYESLGGQQVKNIPKPIPVYRVLSSPKALSAKMFRKATLAVAAVIILCVGLAAVWHYILRARGLTEQVSEPVTPTTVSDESESLITEKPSVAVLPFENMSGDPEQEYFSDGISEDILNGLAKNPGLVVKARTSSFAFKGRNQDIREIGKKLNATHVIEGSVRKSGKRVRVTAQLIEAKNDAHIWSEQYDRELTDVFGIQDEIAGKILSELRIHLPSPSDEGVVTTNIEAYNAYLLGRYQLERGQLNEAVASLERARALDPDYVEVYAALLHAHLAYVGWGVSTMREKLPVIEGYRDKIGASDPSDPRLLYLDQLLNSQGLTENPFPYQELLDRYGASLRRHPNDADMLLEHGGLLMLLGRYDLSIRVIDKALELDPINPGVHATRGGCFLFWGHLPEARRSFVQAETLGMSMALYFSWLAFLNSDGEAIQKQLDRGKSEWSYTAPWYAFYEAAVSYLKGDHDKVKESLALARENTDYLPYYCRSYMAALEGNLDMALDLFAQAITEFEPGAIGDARPLTVIRAVFPDYRSHPRYQKMLRDVGLDEESIAKLKIPPLPF